MKKIYLLTLFPIEPEVDLDVAESNIVNMKMFDSENSAIASGTAMIKDNTKSEWPLSYKVQSFDIPVESIPDYVYVVDTVGYHKDSDYHKIEIALDIIEAESLKQKMIRRLSKLTGVEIRGISIYCGNWWSADSLAEEEDLYYRITIKRIKVFRDVNI